MPHVAPPGRFGGNQLPTMSTDAAQPRPQVWPAQQKLWHVGQTPELDQFFGGGAVFPANPHVEIFAKGHAAPPAMDRPVLTAADGPTSEKNGFVSLRTSVTRR